MRDRIGGFDQVGGAEAVALLSRIFHARVAGDSGLRRLFPADMDALEERLALFLAELMGGPADYTARRGKTSIGCRHAHLPIRTEDAEGWLGHMFAAMEEAGIAGPVADRLREYLRETAHSLSDPFADLYDLPIGELKRSLEENPALATMNHYGRTLLGEACLRWDVERVRRLLEFGADVSAGGGMDHDALYQTARGGGGREGEGVAIVGLLVRHGADVNRGSGPGRGTPLHMAARRGHRALAEALLDAGATIDIQDSSGVTPLLRAVNCGKAEVVCLLIGRGADWRIADKKGVRPADAARQNEIIEFLRDAGRGAAYDRR
jgi:hemoglobin